LEGPKKGNLSPPQNREPTQKGEKSKEVRKPLWRAPIKAPQRGNKKRPSSGRPGGAAKKKIRVDTPPNIPAPSGKKNRNLES